MPNAVYPPFPGWHPAEDPEPGLSLWRSDVGTWAVFVRGSYVPGVFGSREAATRAAEIPHAEIAALRDRVNRVTGEYRPISTADLDSIRPSAEETP